MLQTVEIVLFQGFRLVFRFVRELGKTLEFPSLQCAAVHAELKIYI